LFDFDAFCSPPQLTPFVGNHKHPHLANQIEAAEINFDKTHTKRIRIVTNTYERKNSFQSSSNRDDSRTLKNIDEASGGSKRAGST